MKRPPKRIQSLRVTDRLIVGDRSTVQRCITDILYGESASTDVASIATAADDEVTVTVTGAAFGDHILGVGCSISLGGLNANAYISAANTVKVVLSNNTGGAVDLAAAVFSVSIMKHAATV
jgi:hypothetical protein